MRHEEERLQKLQSRIADTITNFAGSMTFVYVHIAWFTIWIVIGIEHYPFGLLTMIVSLEAIFLSTFVMISQNRADARRQVLADAQWQTVQTEEHQNEQIITLSNQILELTTAIHKMTNELSTLTSGPPAA
jgi:Predicted membrane protein